MSREIGGIFRLKSKKLRLSSKKRSKSNSIIAPMSVPDAEDDAYAGTGSGACLDEIYQDEKVFSNGEYYNGQWLDNIPHGHGKYLWNDGCIYVGEWKHGKTMGKGRFTWSCGATYDGEFQNGYMDGEGTYTGSNGDTYTGSWVMNLRHGQGIMSSDIGDCYDGEWKGGVQEGQGNYQWNCGHTYVGQWKDGTMNGNGTLTWANGNEYEGCWEAGVPKGDGTFKWPDGSYYAGFWSTDTSEQSGTYYPAQGSPDFEDLGWEPQDVYANSFKDCRIWQGEEITLFPSQKMLNWPNEGEFFQRQLTSKSDNEMRWTGGNSWGPDNHGSGKKALVEGLESLKLNDHAPDQIRPLLLPKMIKQQGETISKGHKNYELMLNLQIGIRHSVARPGPAANVDLNSSAFDPREKLWTRFPPEGSKNTPPHPSCEFRWKDYCPLVFRTLRMLFKVDPADYMLSICGNDALRELSSPGKSGSFFYLTHDDKYMIKTMKKSEVKVLLRMLPAYYNHVRTFEDTLVTRFFGLHCVKLIGAAQKKVRFVIMGNLFCTEHAIHRRFDLKGSSHGRTTDKTESEIDPTTTLKDLDLNYIFRLQRFWFQEFCRQVDRDCDFLEQERIMDYSLLVGLHFRDSCSKTVAVANNDSDTELVVPHLSRVSETDKLVFDPTQWESIRLGINMPARAEVTVRRADCEAQLVGEPTGECYEVIIFFGIIDILQDYDISKKLEHAYKAFQYDPTSISAVDPKQYSKRFRDFIFKVFSEDS